MTTREEKARRMELRRKNGTRAIPPFQKESPRFYKSQLLINVCFDCREGRKAAINHSPHFCHSCSRPMIEMGPTFKIPRKSDRSQWRKIEILYGDGERFNSYGRELKLPRRLSEIDVYFGERNERLTPPK